MSKLRPSHQDRHEFKFSEWMDGSPDPYLNRIEMKPQELKHETQEEFECGIMCS